jgi:predicted nucleic acid-binding protein
MGWVEDLHGTVIGLDTAPFIYYTEPRTDYADLLFPFFEAVEQGKITIVTSIVTLVETLVLPLRKGDAKLADQYRNMLFNTDNLSTIMLSQGIAEEAAKLRALHGFRIADAIQIATAIDASSSFFLTNDRQLQKASAIAVLVLDDLR